MQPLLAPRFAVGAGLATLFLVLLINLAAPRVPLALSALSPAELFRLMDRGVQQLYGKGLKAYEQTNAWQEQFTNFKSTTVKRLRFVIEWIEVPMEGSRKPKEPEQQKERSPREKSSGLMPSVGFEGICS